MHTLTKHLVMAPFQLFKSAKIQIAMNAKLFIYPNLYQTLQNIPRGTIPN